MDRDNKYKQHILDALAEIESYLAGVDYPAFLKNSMMQSAVVRQLEIVGEASKRLSDDLK